MGRNKLCIGIDIGASSVKLCQLRAVKTGYALENFSEAALPPDTLIDGALMSASRVLEAVQSLLAQSPLKTKRVALSISGRSVIIKTISVPQMSRSELDQAVAREAAQYIPFDINDVFVDLQIVGPNLDQKDRMDVLLVAAKRDFVNEYTSLLAEAGLEPVVCDVDAFAVQTLYESTHDAGGDEPIALCNLGAVKTNFNVVQRGICKFTRDLEWGGNLLTAEIQKFYGISYEEAERVKLGTAALPPELEQSMQRVGELISGDILRALDLYASSNNDVTPSRIYLSGGVANDPRIVKAIQAATTVPIHLIDMNRKILIPPSLAEVYGRVGPGAAVVAGLALRYMGDG
jgi:type IV pilus assembly protein PilM